uniref:Uncharacterized protein n=1 Tax=Arundo donax TaxID=35708 RepID=A0A0A9H3E0_ARUDO
MSPQLRILTLNKCYEHHLS